VMHKRRGHEAVTVCPEWLSAVSWGFYASHWWKYVTCKRCLAKRQHSSDMEGHVTAKRKGKRR
jgi:hypothetical protein